MCAKDSAYPLHDADEPWDGRVMVAPLGICVEVNSLLLKYQLMGEKKHN